jgi:hypothetical protein
MIFIDTAVRTHTSRVDMAMNIWISKRKEILDQSNDFYLFRKGTAL